MTSKKNEAGNLLPMTVTEGVTVYELNNLLCEVMPDWETAKKNVKERL